MREQSDGPGCIPWIDAFLVDHGQGTLHEPVDYTRLTNATQDWAVRWMNQIHAPSPVPVVASGQ
jgi:hypothetical protein